LLSDGTIVQEQTQPCEVPALGDAQRTFAIAIPAKPGNYQVEAALIQPGANPVRSLRDFTVK
jgi:hypothetical protein